MSADVGDGESDAPPGVEDPVPVVDGESAHDDQPGDAPSGGTMEAELEHLVGDIERITAERDKLLDDAQRLAAEFANFRKQTDKRQVDMAGQAGAGLIERLLPVLDACDSATHQGAEDVAPIREMFRDFLAREGLDVVDGVGVAFDPTVHEAVLREDGDEGDDQVVTEVLRSGYVLNGHVLRAAMVKVRG
ncbi:MAG: nucleotide exchange factor GrpE [Acidimicrobiia bacterium]|nr:nucleotide exchange factor GrpE [Acidimicrobiia bacterium]